MELSRKHGYNKGAEQCDQRNIDSNSFLIIA